jgi:hypothetical protein
MPPQSTLPPLCIGITLTKFYISLGHHISKHCESLNLGCHACVAMHFSSPLVHGQKTCGRPCHAWHTCIMPLHLSLSHNYSTLGKPLFSLSLPNATNNFSLGQFSLPQASHPPWPITKEAANSLSLYKKALAGYTSTFGSHFSLPLLPPLTPIPLLSLPHELLLPQASMAGHGHGKVTKMKLPPPSSFLSP